MINHAMLVGYVGKDPELRTTDKGVPFCELRVATDASYKDKDGNKVARTDWHNVQVWRDRAEHCASYLHKGSLVHVEGMIKYQEWNDGEGAAHNRTVIQASRIYFLDRPKREATPETPEQNILNKSPVTPPDPLEGEDDIPF